MRRHFGVILICALGAPLWAAVPPDLSAGVKSYVEKVATKDGSVTRVRAGPFASKEAADAAVGKISGLGFGNAKVVSR